MDVKVEGNMTSIRGSITINKDSCKPLVAYQKLSVQKNWKCSQRSAMSYDVPVSPNKLRVVCISDTHSQQKKLSNKVPDGDVLLHTGDFTNVGLAKEVKDFNEFLGEMPHKLKIVIAGNHDLTFDNDLVQHHREYLRQKFRISEEGFEMKLKKYGVSDIKELLTNCIYLEDATIDVCGLKIYGSPWQPEFCHWGFNLPRGENCLCKWNLIPDHTDILMTHGPPIGHGDFCYDGNRVGCVELLATIQQRVKPKYHIFGHIHEGYGITTDGVTTFINASTCTLQYKPCNKPIVEDISIPEGHSKDELNITMPQRLISRV